MNFPAPPRYLENGEAIMLELNKALYRSDPVQFDRVLRAGSGNIEPEFLGFVRTYYHLARLIPLDWTIVDLGCAYAPQAFYFVRHARYVGIDVGSVTERFSFANTTHYEGTIQSWLLANPVPAIRTFAICNYMPDYGAQKMIREHFEHLYLYYPE